jgi:hypothetical protein
MSSGGCLKLEVVCLFRTASIPGLVYAWKYIILVLFGLKLYHEMEGGWGLVWNSSYGSMISHTTFCRNKALFLGFKTTPVLYILPFLRTRVAI